MNPLYRLSLTRQPLVRSTSSDLTKATVQEFFLRQGIALREGFQRLSLSAQRVPYLQFLHTFASSTKRGGGAGEPPFSSSDLEAQLDEALKGKDWEKARETIFQLGRDPDSLETIAMHSHPFVRFCFYQFLFSAGQEAEVENCWHLYERDLIHKNLRTENVDDFGQALYLLMILAGGGVQEAQKLLYQMRDASISGLVRGETEVRLDEESKARLKLLKSHLKVPEISRFFQNLEDPLISAQWYGFERAFEMKNLDRVVLFVGLLMDHESEAVHEKLASHPNSFVRMQFYQNLFLKSPSSIKRFWETHERRFSDLSDEVYTRVGLGPVDPFFGIRVLFALTGIEEAQRFVRALVATIKNPEAREIWSQVFEKLQEGMASEAQALLDLLFEKTGEE